MEKTIEEILDEEVKLKDNFRMFYKEMKQNLKLETVCILACEAGEWATEIATYLGGIAFQNEIGILGGITAGGSYALYHVYKHAKKHNTKNVALTDAAAYAASTESGCIIGATLSEYSAGKFIATTNNPLTFNNAMIRGVALAPAFAIGLVLMSAFTYNKKKETARYVTKKGALEKIKPGLEHHLNKNKLEIKGRNNSITIKETNLPKTYQKDFNKEIDSLYTLQSKIVRAKPEYSHEIEEYCEELFKKAGYDLIPVENIYSCSGHHSH